MFFSEIQSREEIGPKGKKESSSNYSRQRKAEKEWTYMIPARAP
jgi:hypothetical protein